VDVVRDEEPLDVALLPGARRSRQLAQRHGRPRAEHREGARARVHVLAPVTAHVLIEHPPRAAEHGRAGVGERVLGRRADEERQIAVAELGGEPFERGVAESLERVRT
jgi:hypothetical protein